MWVSWNRIEREGWRRERSREKKSSLKTIRKKKKEEPACHRECLPLIMTRGALSLIGVRMLVLKRMLCVIGKGSQLWKTDI